MHGTKHGPGNVTAPRAPVCPGSGGRAASLPHTPPRWKTRGFLQGVTPLGASPEGIFGTVGENRLLAHPLLCFRDRAGTETREEKSRLS